MMLAQTGAVVSLTPLYIICGYLALLVFLGVFTARLFRGTSADYFVASRSIGSFLLLMSVFGTTMTAFALVGSTGKAFEDGIGVYGLMASSSGLIHSLVFFFIGIRLWAIGKRYNYVTQIQFFRDRFESNALGYLLFPILVGLVVPYLLIGLVGAGVVVRGVTGGMFPGTFPGEIMPNDVVRFAGAVPPWLTALVISGVVLFYIFLGGVRGAVWANTLQTIVFMITAVVTFVLISNRLGGLTAATQAVLDMSPDHLAREGKISHAQFLSYMLVPLSVAMFPHLFQHWLTARSAKTFRLTIVAHPLFIMIVWVPCILIGIWAVTGLPKAPPSANATLGAMVGQLLQNPFLTGLVTAGILAAIMSSLDSQFVCLGSIFTNDIVVHATGEDRFTDRQKVMLGRGFVVAIVLITYLLSLLPQPNIFDLAVWCFSGFASLSPLVFAALYWKRTTRAGAIASVGAMAVTWFYFFQQDILFPSAEATQGAFLVLGMMPVAVIFAVSTVALVGVSLVTKPPSDATIRKFFETRTRS